MYQLSNSYYNDGVLGLLITRPRPTDTQAPVRYTSHSDIEIVATCHGLWINREYLPLRQLKRLKGFKKYRMLVMVLV